MNAYDAMRVARTMKEGPSCRLVFVMLAGRIGSHERAWPAISTLCEDTGLGDTAVRTALKELVAGGHIGVTHRPGTSSLWTIGARHIPTRSASHSDASPSESDARRVRIRRKKLDIEVRQEVPAPNGAAPPAWIENGDGTVSRPQEVR